MWECFRKKKDCWTRIENEFNGEGTQECYRNSNTLKNKFENLCRRATEKKSNLKKHISGTGSGERSTIYLTSTDETALNLLGARASGLPNQEWCDDEGIFN